MNLAGTGHRPPRLFSAQPYSERNVELLDQFAFHLLGSADQLAEVSYVITGGALGFDQSLAERKRLADLCDSADNVIVMADTYTPPVYELRDRKMVDDCDLVLALWDCGYKGGTALTVRYAVAQEKPVINCYDRWLEFRSKHE
jgi:hypothetical protein